MTSRFLIPLVFSLALALPLVAFAQDSGQSSDASTGGGSAAAAPAGTALSQGGIYNCNPVGAQSVGSTVATGGTYVPVADATVELNTGYLVYKECLLRPLVDDERKALTAADIRQDLNLFHSGNGGNPYWVVNYGNDFSRISDTAFNNAVRSGMLSALNPAFQNPVETALVRNYYYSTQQPQGAFTCPYTGDLGAVLNGTTQDVWGGLDAMINPACSPYSAYVLAQDQLSASVAFAQNQWLNQLNWNNGLYSVTDAGGNVLTPGFLLGAIATQAVTSPLRQMENVNDIGQMLGVFFNGIEAQLFTDAGGIADLLVNKSTGFPKVLSETQNGLLSSALGTALTTLDQMLSWEQQYNSAEKSIRDLVSTTQVGLQSAQNKCWDLIIQNVCTAAPSGGTCTGKSGGTLTIATSTYDFAGAVIAANPQIASIEAAVKKNIATSNKNLDAIQQLIDDTNSSDPTTRNNALQTLDALVKSGKLDTQQNVTEAQDELQKAQTAFSDQTQGLLSTTLHRWAGDASDGTVGAIAWDGTLPPNGTDAGWCNINQKQTLDNWAKVWSR